MSHENIGKEEDMKLTKKQEYQLKEFIRIRNKGNVNMLGARKLIRIETSIEEFAFILKNFEELTK